MVNPENYRSSKDYREILRILQKASLLQENFLWQSHALGRNIIPVQHFEIDFVAREVVVSIDPQRFKLASELPLYVKLDYRTSVFKVMDFRQNQSTIHFPFPTEVKTQELRLLPRHQFLPNEDKVVSIRPSLTTGTRDSGGELQMRILDASTNGLGLMVSERNRSFLKNNRILWVTKLDEIELEYPLLAEVVYINNEVEPKYQVRKQRDLKVGLKISGSFPSEVFQNFIQ